MRETHREREQRQQREVCERERQRETERRGSVAHMCCYGLISAALILQMMGHKVELVHPLVTHCGTRRPAGHPGVDPGSRGGDPRVGSSQLSRSIVHFGRRDFLQGVLAPGSTPGPCCPCARHAVST